MRTRSLHLPGTMAVLALGLFLNGTVRADILADQKARQALEAQRLEKVVDDALKDAYRIARSRPSEAVEILKTTLDSITNSTVLSNEKQASLTRRVNAVLKDLQVNPVNRRDPPADPPRSGRVEEERRRAETESIRQYQSNIQSLRGSGKDAEARRMFDELRRRFPDNTAVQAGGRVGSTADHVSQIADLKRDQSERFLMVMRDIDKTAARIPIDNVEFSADWREKMARRNKNNQVTEKEKAIMKALNTVIPVEFNMNSFQDILDYLEKKTGLPLIVDKQAMTEAGVTYDSQITFKAKTTLRTVLKRILGDLNLTYIVKDQTIQITSIQRAKETLSVRTYYVGDLVGFGNGLNFGPYMARAQMAQQVAQLAVLITQVVEPDSWLVNDRGGLGTIAFNPVTMSFVVRQTAEIHYLMGIGMR